MSSPSQELQSNGRQWSVKEAAKRTGLSEMQIGNMIRRARRNEEKQHNMAGLAFAANRSKTRLPDGSLDYFTDEQMEQIEEQLRNEQKKPGYGTSADLQRAVGAETGVTKREVGECATLWHENGKLPGEEGIVGVPVRDKRGRNYTRTMRVMKYAVERFKELWTKTLRDNVGVAHLNLLLPFGTARPVAEVDDEMKQNGFIGVRFSRVKQLAGVIAQRPEHKDNKGPAWLYKRIDSRKQTELAHTIGVNRRTLERLKAAGKINPPDIKKIVEELFADGILLVRDFHKALAGLGLSRQVSAVIRAQGELEYEAKRIGPRGTPSVCKINGREWPSEEEVQRMLQANGRAGTSAPVREVLSEGNKISEIPARYSGLSLRVQCYCHLERSKPKPTKQPSIIRTVANILGADSPLNITADVRTYANRWLDFKAKYPIQATSIEAEPYPETINKHR